MLRRERRLEETLLFRGATRAPATRRPDRRRHPAAPGRVSLGSGASRAGYDGAPMPAPSLTSTESFQWRAQKSERSRAALMGVVFATVIAETLTRRLSGGVVMASDAVFYPRLGVLAAAALFELFVWWRIGAATRAGRLLAPWRWRAQAVAELLVPGALLAFLHFFSPRGEYAALSAPALLLFPIVILVSALRLKPRLTLWTGLGAAGMHLTLVVTTIVDENTAREHWPVLMSYGALLALTGVAGSLVARSARRHVEEAVEEATAREQASRALANIERDMDVSREIQAGLFPVGAPEFPGFDIAGINRSADKTGGDYYDWQPLPDGRLLVVIADVTGHGIGPALVMSVCRAYARASAPLDADLGSLLARLNGLLLEDLRGARFITLAMAILGKDGRVELLSAGHGPTMLYRAREKRVEQFGGDGLPLAIMEQESYGPTRPLTLAPGDALALLTDGYFEWPNGTGEKFGTDRLAAALAESASRGAGEILERTRAAVEAFAGATPQNDDLTMVVIKRRG